MLPDFIGKTSRQCFRNCRSKCYGITYRIEVSDLPPEQAANLDLIEAGFGGLFDDDDAAMLCEGMVPGSAIVGLAIENTWAVA